MRTYLNFPEELDYHKEFDLSTSRVSAMVCYVTQEGSEVIAIAADDNTVISYTVDVSLTTPHTCMLRMHAYRPCDMQHGVMTVQEVGHDYC